MPVSRRGWRICRDLALLLAGAALIVVPAYTAGCAGGGTAATTEPALTTTSTQAQPVEASPSTSTAAPSGLTATSGGPSATAAASTSTTSTTTTSSSTTSSSTTTTTTVTFDASRAMAHVKKLAVEIGPRHGGSEAEMAAVAYAVGYLDELGYRVDVADVPIPNGLTSHNVIAVKEGSSPLTVVVGGHMDSWGPSPGGNDNASGAAAILELARDLRDAQIVPTVMLVLFGNEEMIDKDLDHHHYGSRTYVGQLTAAARTELAAMISLDMIAYGDTFRVRTMGKGPQTLRDMLLAHADETKAGPTYLKDPSAYGWSDHEPFELAGIPAAWLEWYQDPLHHTARDTYKHCDATKLQEAGDFVLSFLSALDLGDVQQLKEANTAK